MAGRDTRISRKKRRHFNFPPILEIIIILAALVFASLIVTVFFTGLPLDPERSIMKFNTHAPEGSDTISFMTYNIHYGSGYTNDYIKDAEDAEVYRYLDDVADIISQADIVALQEVDRNVRRSHFVDELSYLAREANFSYAVFADNWNVKLPFLGIVALGRLRTGHAVLSRFPITSHEIKVFQKPNASFWHRLFFVWRTQQILEIDIDGTEIRVFNVHLESESRIDRQDQAAQLNSWISTSKKPSVMMGDFNALVPEAAEKDFPGENYIDDTTMDIIRSSGLRELFPEKQYSQDEQRYFTFPSRHPDRRLDYFFFTEDFNIVYGETLEDERVKEASDHLPLKVKLRLE